MVVVVATPMAVLVQLYTVVLMAPLDKMVLLLLLVLQIQAVAVVVVAGTTMVVMVAQD